MNLVMLKCQRCFTAFELIPGRPLSSLCPFCQRRVGPGGLQARVNANYAIQRDHFGLDFAGRPARGRATIVLPPSPRR